MRERKVKPVEVPFEIGKLSEVKEGAEERFLASHPFIKSLPVELQQQAKMQGYTKFVEYFMNGFDKVGIDLLQEKEGLKSREERYRYYFDPMPSESAEKRFGFIPKLVCLAKDTKCFGMLETKFIRDIFGRGTADHTLLQLHKENKRVVVGGQRLRLIGDNPTEFYAAMVGYQFAQYNPYQTIERIQCTVGMFDKIALTTNDSNMPYGDIYKAILPLITSVW